MSILVLLFHITVEKVLAETQPPIVIAQVEMSNHMESEPLTTCSGFETIANRPDSQWIELRNTVDKTIIINGFTIKVENELNRTVLQDGPNLSSMVTIKPKQNCAYVFSCALMQSSDQRCIQDTKNIVFTFEYSSGGKLYADGDDLYSNGGKIYKISTPPLTDTYDDTRTWQMVNGEWKFEELGLQQDTSIANPASPLKQFMSGVAASDVKCSQSFQLILKVSDDSPACVKPETKEKLIERGWAKEV